MTDAAKVLRGLRKEADGYASTVARKLRGIALDLEQFKAQAPTYYHEWYRERMVALRAAADQIKRSESNAAVSARPRAPVSGCRGNDPRDAGAQLSGAA